MWHCVCDCGKEKDIWSHALISGLTKSCGCIQKEVITAKNTSHGMSGTRLNRIFRNMQTRCYNINFPEFYAYGGRGIKVCNEWLNEPQRFYDWALSNGYNDSLSIDRIDTNRDYEPLNCRWVDRVTQNNNKRNNVTLEFCGEEHTMAEWAKILHMKYQTLKCRIQKYGWSVERALTEPVRK